jgi:hypothetical protein
MKEYNRYILCRGRNVSFSEQKFVQYGCGGGTCTHGCNYSPNIWGAEIVENKIKWYLTVITVDCIELEKNRSVTFELRGTNNPIAPP